MIWNNSKTILLSMFWMRMIIRRHQMMEILKFRSTPNFIVLLWIQTIKTIWITFKCLHYRWMRINRRFRINLKKTKVNNQYHPKTLLYSQGQNLIGVIQIIMMLLLPLNFKDSLSHNQWALSLSFKNLDLAVIQQMFSSNIIQFK